jgi:hypothetical protein
MPFYLLIMAIVAAVRETDLERQQRLVRLYQKRSGYRPCGSYDK